MRHHKAGPSFIISCQTRYIWVAVLSLVTCACFSQDLKLWYSKPADKWTDALPIGNGRLGAMIYGGIGSEHIQFNEATLWTGRPREYARKGAYKYLQPIRQLLSEGRQKEAETLAAEHFMGLKDVDDSLYVQQKAAWLAKIRSDESPAAAGFDDSKWKTMQLPTLNGWETAGLEGTDGAVWFRTSFELPATWKATDMWLDLGRIRDLDFTYINGQQTGTAEGISTKRHYRIPASVLHPGANVIAVQVVNFYDKGGFTGLKSGKPFILYAGSQPDTGVLQLPASWRYQVQDDNPPAFPQYEASYQPFGDVFFKFDKMLTADVTQYRQELDIGNATATVSYSSNGVDYKREYIASAPANLLAIHLTASKPGNIDLSAFFQTLHKQFNVSKINGHTLALHVKVRNGVLSGVAYLTVTTTNGRVSTQGNNLIIENADEATFYLSAATSFKNYKDVSAHAATVALRPLQASAARSFAVIKAAHTKDYQLYFNRFAVQLGNQPPSSLTTDQRIKNYTHQSDPGLLALYMQYGRYLLISSSRPGGQPANLQGLWNENLTPSWGSKYTTNINLEMNYWPVDLLNLPECSGPLFMAIGELAMAGKSTAREHYNAPGWVLHHNTDIWRGTAPINASDHGIWVTGAAWLCHHIWDHFQFTGDTAFLKKHYAEMKEASRFFTRFLVKDPVSGRLISTPSNSPEHGGLVAGPTMDHQIIRDLLTNCIAASGILEDDPVFRKLMQQKRDSLAPNKIGRFGELQEWMEEKEDTTEKHRHVSHLWGVYPGTDITWKTAPVMNAARQSLLYRGDEGTGWSIAWKVNLWARFRDGDHALMMMDKLLSPADDGAGEKGGVYKNMFDAHPPFQIDGNFGGAAGLAEMIVQSQDGIIELLPALPSGLPSGEMKGLCARGGFELNIQWKQGKLSSVEIFSKNGNECRLSYGDKQVTFKTLKGKRYTLNAMLETVKDSR